MSAPRDFDIHCCGVHVCGTVRSGREHWLALSCFMPHLKTAHTEVLLTATRANRNYLVEHRHDAFMGLV